MKNNQKQTSRPPIPLHSAHAEIFACAPCIFFPIILPLALDPCAKSTPIGISDDFQDGIELEDAPIQYSDFPCTG